MYFTRIQTNITCLFLSIPLFTSVEMDNTSSDTDDSKPRRRSARSSPANLPDEKVAAAKSSDYGVLFCRAYYHLKDETLVVEVFKCKGLEPMDNNGLSDPVNFFISFFIHKFTF